MSEPSNKPSVMRQATMDGEHRVQTGLIDALCAAVDADDGIDKVGEILDQLVAYSKAHFMSEELLMRLDSYEGYDEHVADHGQMIDALDAMVAHHAAGQTPLLPGQARSLLAFMSRHIESRDALYATWTRA